MFGRCSTGGLKTFVVVYSFCQMLCAPGNGFFSEMSEGRESLGRDKRRWVEGCRVGRNSIGERTAGVEILTPGLHGVVQHQKATPARSDFQLKKADPASHPRPPPISSTLSSRDL